MEEYRKIPNVFKFDANYKNIIGLNEPFDTLKDIKFIGTEKLDGTNTRIYWDGHKIQIAGRTDKSQWQGDLYKTLSEMFLTDRAEYLFEQVFGEKEAYIFGESVGPKIQAGGELYCSKPDFYVFDVTIDGNELNYYNVADVAKKLGLKVVSLVFSGNLKEAIDFVSAHQTSTLSLKHEMEGIVLTPEIDLYDRKGHRLKCKLKWKDLKYLNAKGV